MHKSIQARFFAPLCLAVWLTAPLLAQEEDSVLTAKARLFPTIGPGLRSVKVTPDGSTYVLTAPNPAVSVFGKDGKLVRTVPNYSDASGPAVPELRAISFGEGMDVDSSGTVYVADRAANAVKIWDMKANGRLVPVNSPVSVAALADGEVAIATLREPRLILVFDKNGREVREFGEPEEITERTDLNRFLNIGQVLADNVGHVFYAFAYTPEPTIRQYDRAGYAGQDVQYTSLDAAPAAQAIRHEIQKQEKKRSAPIFKRVLTGAGVDRETGELWMTTGNNLHRYDKDGTRRASYKLYTPEGARLDASVVTILRDRILIGNDPLGIYLFDRPDKKMVQ
jgi:hypothetical protein